MAIAPKRRCQCIGTTLPQGELPKIESSQSSCCYRKIIYAQNDKCLPALRTVTFYTQIDNSVHILAQPPTLRPPYYADAERGVKARYLHYLHGDFIYSWLSRRFAFVAKMRISQPTDSRSWGTKNGSMTWMRRQLQLSGAIGPVL